VIRIYNGIIVVECVVMLSCYKTEKQATSKKGLITLLDFLVQHRCLLTPPLYTRIAEVNMATDGNNTKPLKSGSIFCFDVNNLQAWKFAMRAEFLEKNCLDIVEGERENDDFLSDELNSENSADEDALVQVRAGRNEFKKNQSAGFNLLTKSMGNSMSNISMFANDAPFGDLRAAWNCIWNLHDSKKPATQSVLNSDFSALMQDTDVFAFLNQINEICSRMTEPPSDGMKKAQVVKGIEESLLEFAHNESLKPDVSWMVFMENIRDRAAQIGTIDEFRKKRNALSASLEDRTGSVNMIGKKNFGNRKKKEYEEKMSKIQCFNCLQFGHYKDKCPNEMKKEKKKDRKSDKKKFKKKKKGLNWHVRDEDCSNSSSSDSG
jgi:hypothetical protein